MPTWDGREVRSIDRRAALRSVQITAAIPADTGETSARFAILLAGLSLFADRGYHATSIRDIAAAADCGSASLYSHFRAKEDILSALVQLGHDVHHRALVDALAASAPEPCDQLRHVVFGHVEIHCRYPALALVATHERRHLSPAAYAPSLALRRQSEQLLTDIVIRGIDQKLFAVEALEATLVAIGSMGIAVATWYPDRSDHLTPNDVATAYADLALRMVGAHPDPTTTSRPLGSADC